LSKCFFRGFAYETGDAPRRCQRAPVQSHEFVALFSGSTGSGQNDGSRRKLARGTLLAAALAVGLAGCETAEEPPSGIIGSVEGFAGAVVADEPRAVLVGRDVLSAGGTAADAAVAMYFTLAVTLPSEAGLGGGGVCLIHDPAERTTEALEFLPRAAPGGEVALPGNVRGMAALHARYGALRWEQLLAAPENLARFGTPMSRALAREAATAEDLLRADPELAAIFFKPDGTLLDEGDNFRQVNLAAAIGQIRQQGGGALYVGSFAATLADAAQSIGAPLTTEALRGTLPSFRDTVRLDYGNHVLHVPPPPAAGGLVEAQLIGLLTEGHDYGEAPASERPHLLAEASKRVFAEQTRWMQPDGSSSENPATLLGATHLNRLMENYQAAAATPAAELDPPPAGRPENPWATGFVAVDRRGRAVACNVTMNGLFGAGRVAPGTGIILAPAPNAAGAGATALGPMILSNTPTGELFYAAAASGGPTAATAMAAVFLGVAELDEPLEQAVAATRIHHNGNPDAVFYEEGLSSEALGSLTDRGHQVGEAGILGRVGAVWCPEGLPVEPDSCQAAADTRSSGLAVILAEPE
jgi:gamma-glutamyltranspeptidase/glutathione hydrolase